MRRQYFLIVTAFTEVGTGLMLLSLPQVAFAYLLGVRSAAPEADFVGRIAGAALLALGLIAWLARDSNGGAGLRAALVGILAYDVAAAGLLAYGGSALDMSGVLLWPAVALHTAMAVWCVACLRPGARDPSAEKSPNWRQPP